MGNAAVLTGIFGEMGSGKSYEAVKYHTCPAIRQGQVIATNLKGLNLTAISKYVKKPLDECVIIDLPSTREALFAPGVFPDPLDWSKPSLIPPGAFVIIDEASTIFGKEPPEHIMRYITEQRHGVDAKGNTGRMLLISQSWTHIHRSVRSIISLTFQISKFQMLAPFMRFLRPIKLGFDYRCEVFTVPDKNPSRTKPNNRLSRRYEPEIFPLYKSYDANSAKELQLDRRSTILGSAFATIFVPLFVIGGYYASDFLRGKFGGAFGAAPVASSPAKSSTSGSASESRLPAASAQPTSAPTASSIDANLSTKYRLVGHYTINSTSVFLVEGDHGIRQLFYDDISATRTRGSAMEVTLKSGEIISFHTGAYTPKQGGTTNAPATTSQISGMATTSQR